MGINRQIVVSGILLIATAAYLNFFMQKTAARRKSLTKILLGGYILVLLASILDFLYPPAGALANLILLGAVITSAWTILPDVFAKISGNQGPKGA